jgi:signal transduction histidine kinase
MAALAALMEEILAGSRHEVQLRAAELSHEFRNPLAAIRTATELLGDLGGGNGGVADRECFLSMIEREVTRLERLLSGVRDLAALDREPAPRAVTPVALDALRALVSGSGSTALGGNQRHILRCP